MTKKQNKVQAINSKKGAAARPSDIVLLAILGYNKSALRILSVIVSIT